MEDYKQICWSPRRVKELFKCGVPITIKTAFEDFFRGRINKFGRQLVPGFDNADRKCKLAACQMGPLMAKFEARATKIWNCWRLEKFINGEVHPAMEYVIHQDQVRAIGDGPMRGGHPWFN